MIHRFDVRSRSGRMAAVSALALFASLGAVSSASAQSAFDRSGNVGVLDRPHPEYDALGIRTGSFLIYPKVEIGIGYDDNVYAAEDDAIEDVIYSVSPSVSVESTWSRHSLGLSAAANIQRYADLGNEDTDQYRLQATGRLDIRRDANITGSVGYVSAVESRGSSGYTTVTRSPIEYDTVTATLAGVKDFNRVRLSGRLGVTDTDYKDNVSFAGAPIDFDFRDNQTDVASARLDYAVSPATALFGEVGFTNADYDNSNRDSDGVRLLGGVNFELTNLVTGEVSAGYITRAFDDGLTSDVEQFAYRASLNYYPTQLLTVGLKGETTINDSGVLITPAYVSDSVGLQLDYEVLRNLIVTGVADYSRDDYQDIDRTDDRYGAGATATYLLNRRAGVSLTYSQLTQDSSGAARNVDYTERTLSLALVLQL